MNPFIVVGEATVSGILTDITAIVTQAGSWVSTFATQVVSTPLLMTFAGVPLVGLGVGLLRRLLSVN